MREKTITIYRNTASYETDEKNTENNFMLWRLTDKEFEKLWKLIDSMSENEQVSTFNFGDNFSQKEAHWERDKNLRDVLVHLYEWHQLLLHWVESNQRGEAKPFLPEPYNWKTYGKMNVEFWRKHQSVSYEESKKMLFSSHKQTYSRNQA